MTIISIPRDTDLKAAQNHISILRRKSATDRVQMAMDLSDSVRETCIAGIKQRHPDYSADMIHFEALRLSIGEDLFNKISGFAATFSFEP